MEFGNRPPAGNSGSDEAFNPALSPEAIESRFSIAWIYGFGLLYAFDAVRFPQRPLYKKVYVDKAGRWGEKGEILHDHDTEHLINPDVSLAFKADIIRWRFQRMGRSLNAVLAHEIPSEGAYERVEKFLSRVHTEQGVGQDLKDTSSREPIPVQDILPGKEVIEAMWTDFVMNNRRRCKQLEAFITQFSVHDS